MDHGSMTDICKNGTGNFSEDFYRYTLYKVAKGLHAMHKRDILHKTFNSDYVFYSADGSIKIMDAGLQSILSEH